MKLATDTKTSPSSSTDIITNKADHPMEDKDKDTPQSDLADANKSPRKLAHAGGFQTPLSNRSTMEDLRTKINAIFDSGKPDPVINSLIMKLLLKTKRKKTITATA